MQSYSPLSILLGNRLLSVSIITPVLVVAVCVFSAPIHVWAAENENIQIPSQSVEIQTSPDPSAGPNMEIWTNTTLAVNNVGSVRVTITTIIVQGQSFSYSPTATPGSFTASSNQIQPGQSVTFTVLDTSSPTAYNFLSPSPWSLEAVTSNGTTASTAYSWG